ncbi:hypothetical protein FQR65_LT00733 [Abscondita terminalis]|nr:hypothetical protein FQR65_LT00733 [Abscondita terminalis]
MISVKLRLEVVLCCILATALAASEPRLKKKDDNRNKRTLEYSISHPHNAASSYRSERRISSGVAPQYPLFYPVQKPFTVFKKGLPNVSAPPYAVQMEPLVHYSQPDPLYDANVVPGASSNDIKLKDDLEIEHSHNSRISYAYPPVKHVIERPVYIREPEPIIEIIIKESNITLPPLPTPPVTLAPRKKEQVQVFYVKYKKNPNGYGKDSIVYDKPVPALAPHVSDEPEHIPPPVVNYETVHTATISPPPSTTLRAIVKPDSESYHADKGIHITFGKTVNEQHKRSHTDDAKEESAPQIAISHRHNPSHSPQPQGRQFNPFPTQTLFSNKQSSNVNFDNGHTSHQFKNGNQVFQNNFPVAFTQPQHQFNRNFASNSSPSNVHGVSTRPPSIANQAFLPRVTPPQQFAPIQFNNNSPRQPVPYQPFDQIRHQHVQFPRAHTHFPINQQTSQVNNQFNHNNFQNSPPTNQQLQSPQKLISNIPQFQPLPQQQFSQHFGQPQFNNQFSIQHQRNVNQGASSELIHSLPKFEKHISVPTQSQHQNLAPQQQAIQHDHHHIQQQPNQQHTQQLQQLHQLHLQQQQHLQHFQQLQRQPQLPQNYNNQQDFSSHVEQNVNNPIPQIHKNVIFQQSTYEPTIKQISTTYKPSSTTTTTTPPSTTEGKLTEEDLKALNIQLPDEVPEDLREQLLSSGILKNAQISVLDYDKVGDTSIADLPPDQLANFFSAGGGQQIAAGSDKREVVIKHTGEIVNNDRTVDSSDMEESESSSSEVKVPPPVEMKVVHYDPQSEDGQNVPNAYIKQDATQVDPVALDDQQYNRYLPVKVNGAAFPIPDVPELKGRIITSVVVLAPVDLGQDALRKTRDLNGNHKTGRQLATEALKLLISNPSTENFKDWLDKENKTIIDKQAVILLVTGDSRQFSKEKEIFMYDLATQTVSKLSGELSSAFVDAAETNSQQNLDPIQSASSDIIETRIPYSDSIINQKSSNLRADLEESASEYVHAKVPVIDPAHSDNLSEASEQLESFVNIAGMPVQEDLLAAASNSFATANKFSTKSGYSKTGSSNLFTN